MLRSRLSAEAVFVGPRVAGGEVPEAWKNLGSVGPVCERSLVLDVVVAVGEPALVGWHVQGASRHRTPSGIFDYVTPAEAPSRAYGKAVEGLRWSRAGVRAGDLLLEIGAAPGGTTLAYLEAGLRVLAVDTQAMAPLILAHPGCVGWIQKSIGEVTLEELPLGVQWIAVDAGIAPSRVVRALRRLSLHYRRSLRGMFLTLKLNDAATIAALPGLLDELRRGNAQVHAIQLPTNRSDVFVFVDYEMGRGEKRSTHPSRLSPSRAA